MLLTLPVLSKGVSGVVSLDKEALFSCVTGDAYFADADNVAHAIAVYLSDEGHQKKILKFDLGAAEPEAVISFSEKARDSFLLTRVILGDHDGGSHSLERAQLPAGLDIEL
jgi:hypothetical protein